MASTQINMRLSDETLAELEALRQFLGLSSKAEVVRFMSRRTSLELLKAAAEPPVKLPAKRRGKR